MEVAKTYVAYAVVALVLYTLYGIVWRLYISPISSFPGSKLAALTFWYEFYYDVVKGGEYVYEIEKMHQRYGMSHSIMDPSKQLTHYRFNHSYQSL
jgi:hypothetical protein